MKHYFSLLVALLLPISAFGVDFDNIIVAGPPQMTIDGTSSATNHSIDSSNDTLCFVFQCHEAATLTRVGYRYGARTGTPPTYLTRLEGVSATTGDCDNADVGGGSPTSVTFTPPADASIDGLWQEKTLTNSYACTRGQLLGLAIRYSSGTIDGSNFSSYTYQFSNTVNYPLPYSARVTDGAAATKGQNLTPFSYASASKVYGNPVLSVKKDNYSSDDTPDEYALAFQLDCDHLTTYTVRGMRVNGRTAAAGKTIDYYLYSGTTQEQSVTIDSDTFATNTENGARYTVMFNEVTLTTLACDTEYALSVQPNETAAVLNVHILEVDAADDLDAFPGGQQWYLKTRTNEGAWTSTTDQRPLIDIIIGDVTPPSGGGSAGGGKFNWGIN